MLFLLLAAAYLFAPGHPDVLFAGVPIGQSGVVVLVLLVLVSRIETPRPPLGLLVLLLTFIAVKVTIGTVVPEQGWLAHYYANATFTPPHERSIDYRHLNDATRIDRHLAFDVSSFPVHFFNDRRFNRGGSRELTEPFAVRWQGHTLVNEGESPQAVLAVRGEATVVVDGEQIARVDSREAVFRGPLDVSLAPGWHTITIDYVKPANVAGVLEVNVDPVRVWPQPPSDWRVAATAPMQAIAILVHLAVLALVAHVYAKGFREWGRRVRAGWHRDRRLTALQAAEPIVVIGLMLQGLWKSRHLVDRVWTLSGGDDWMMFELTARDVVLNGVLMTEGAPLGRGAAYFAYPGYTYFTAAVHAVAGESLASVVLANFIVLAVATILIARLAQLLVPASAALLAVVWFAVLQQADFVRYYTVTLLSENLYFATTAAMVLWLTRYVMASRSGAAAAGGLWGGLSAVTRPAAMLWMLFAVLLAFLLPRPLDVRRRALGALLLAIVWMTAILPFTLRNYLVSGEPVLITEGQAKSFIDYNMPSDEQAHYLTVFDGSLSSAAVILVRMLIDEPVGFLRMTGFKLGFTLGMTHWASGIGRHPELLLTSLLYVAALVLVPAARARIALPLHTFVISHLAVVTLSLPWNYGYRMILPMYPFMTVFAMAVPVVMLDWLRSDRAALPTRAPAPPLQSRE